MEHVLFHRAQKPPMTQRPDNREREYQLATTDQAEPKPSCTSHDFRIVQVSVTLSMRMIALRSTLKEFTDKYPNIASVQGTNP